MKLSIIVPVGPGDDAWQALAEDLSAFSGNFEVIFCATERLSASDEKSFAILAGRKAAKWIVSKKIGRATQLNCGAANASGRHLWFLHCDSRVKTDAFQNLLSALSSDAHGLYYFDLAFHDSRSFLMKLTEAGVWLRSHVLKLPFGDQGFCIKEKLFCTLSGFNEGIAVGEDHDFVWKAKKSGVPIRCLNCRILTSARKYNQRGWVVTTLTHLLYTAVQSGRGLAYYLSG